MSLYACGGQAYLSDFQAITLASIRFYLQRAMCLYNRFYALYEYECVIVLLSSYLIYLIIYVYNICHYMCI